MSDKKSVLITGAAGDIGLSISRRFASEGYDLFLGYSSEKSAESLESLKTEFKDISITAIKADVSDSKQVEQMLKQVLEKAGRIDVVVNNAGITDDGFIVRMSDESFDKVLDVNLKGTFYVCRESIKYMARQRYGNIVNMSSLVGLHGNPGQSNYSASKAGVIGLTKSLACEYASRNIIINAVAPGAVETHMFNKIPEDVRKSILERIPLKRTAKPEEIADLVYFLSQSQYITGQVVVIDGGRSA